MSRVDDYLGVHYARGVTSIRGTDDLSFLSDALGYQTVWRLRAAGTVEPWFDVGQRMLTVQRSPAGRRSTFTADHDGDEHEQLHLFDHETGEMRDLAVSHSTFTTSVAGHPMGTRSLFQ